jgi:hypothetical protein
VLNRLLHRNEMFGDIGRAWCAGGTAWCIARGGAACAPGTIEAMETRRLRVGTPITPEQFDELGDEQLARLVPKAYREFFPGKDFCADGSFYLHDGTAWSFYKAGFVDE